MSKGIFVKTCVSCIHKKGNFCGCIYSERYNRECTENTVCDKYDLMDIKPKNSIKDNDQNKNSKEEVYRLLYSIYEKLYSMEYFENNK